MSQAQLTYHPSPRAADKVASMSDILDDCFQTSATMLGRPLIRGAQGWQAQVPIITDPDQATVTFDLSQAPVHLVTLGGNRTLALANVPVGQQFSILLGQDATGSRTVTWFSTVRWSGGSPPTLTTTANKIDSFDFICIATGSYLNTGSSLNM